MESAISNLWNGNIAPCEHCGTQDGKVNQLFTRMRREREVLEAELTADQKARLEGYSQLSEDYLLRMMELAFREGFVVGSQITAEVYSGR